MRNPKIDRFGNKLWIVKGKLHRLEGPAVEIAEDDKILDIVDGTEFKYYKGDKFWFVKGKLHRLDGPAIERADGSVEYWENGIRKFPRFRSIDSEFEVSCD